MAQIHTTSRWQGSQKNKQSPLFSKNKNTTHFPTQGKQAPHPELRDTCLCGSPPPSQVGQGGGRTGDISGGKELCGSQTAGKATGGEGGEKRRSLCCHLTPLSSICPPVFSSSSDSASAFPSPCFFPYLRLSPQFYSLPHIRHMHKHSWGSSRQQWANGGSSQWRGERS